MAPGAAPGARAAGYSRAPTWPPGPLNGGQPLPSTRPPQPPAGSNPAAVPLAAVPLAAVPLAAVPLAAAVAFGAVAFTAGAAAVAVAVLLSTLRWRARCHVGMDRLWHPECKQAALQWVRMGPTVDSRRMAAVQPSPRTRRPTAPPRRGSVPALRVLPAVAARAWTRVRRRSHLLTTLGGLRAACSITYARKVRTIACETCGITR